MFFKQARKKKRQRQKTNYLLYSKRSLIVGGFFAVVVMVCSLLDCIVRIRKKNRVETHNRPSQVRKREREREPNGNILI